MAAQQMAEALVAAIGEEINVDTYPDLVKDTIRATGAILIKGTDGIAYMISVQTLGRAPGWIFNESDPSPDDEEDDRCDWCREHGIDRCRHIGM